MRMYSASGRSRWPWVIAAIAVIVIAIVGVLAFTAGRGSNSAEPTPATSAPPSPSTSPSVPPPTSGADGADEPAPTGCLGGEARDPAMVLAAQQQAPHSMYGAVEVATAYTRWGLQYPFPSAADATVISDALVAETAAADVRDIAGGYAGGGDITGGQVPTDTPFSWSTVGGLWLVSSDSTADRMTVSVNGNYVINGALSPTATGAIALVMVWEGDEWHIEDAERPDVAAIAAGGTTFTGGC